MKNIKFFCFLTFFAVYSLPLWAINQVYVRNYEYPEEIEQQVNFYLKHLGIDSIRVLIVFEAALPARVNGYAVRLNENEYVIKLRKNTDGVTQEMALAHEMVHINQYVKKELTRYSEFSYNWKGNTYADIRRIAHDDRGWEKEADKTGLQLYKWYKKHRKELTPFYSLNE